MDESDSYEPTDEKVIEFLAKRNKMELGYYKGVIEGLIIKDKLTSR